MSGLTMYFLAHAQHVHGSPLVNGLLHPITGLDHLLAALAVGMIAFRAGGKNLWFAPLLFVAGMFAGSHLGLALSIPELPVEMTVAGSLLLLGGLLIAPRINRLHAIYPLLSICAVAHGIAHTQGQNAGPAFVLSVVLATAALHVAGILAGKALQSPQAATTAYRTAGSAVSVVGIVLMFMLVNG